MQEAPISNVHAAGETKSYWKTQAAKLSQQREERYRGLAAGYIPIYIERTLNKKGKKEKEDTEEVQQKAKN